jgi:hypothetical protein
LLLARRTSVNKPTTDIESWLAFHPWCSPKDAEFYRTQIEAGHVPPSPFGEVSKEAVELAARRAFNSIMNADNAPLALPGPIWVAWLRDHERDLRDRLLEELERSGLDPLVAEMEAGGFLESAARVLGSEVVFLEEGEHD